MKGNFDTSFEFSSNKIEHINRKVFNEHLTCDLAHVIKKEELEQYAAKFLSYFCPEALKTPMKVDLEKAYQEKGIKVYKAPLTSDVYGKTYFADDVAEIYDEENNAKRVEIKSGTILINSNKLKQGEGTYRNTLAHEGVHYYFHGNYFKFMFLFGSANTCSIYRIGPCNDENIKWMEHQARKLAPLILMPKKTFKIKYEEIKREVKLEFTNKRPNGVKPNKGYLLNIIAIRLSEFFGTSKVSVKYRLMDIGVLEADCILNYDDEKKERYKPYTFNKKYLSHHQTFNLNERSYRKLIETNEEIRVLIESKELLYLNGLIVANNRKYVSCGKITDYALRNVHECALIFDVKSENRALDDNISKFTLCRNSEASVEAQVNNDQLGHVLSLIDENSKHYEKHRKELPNTPGATITYHIEKLGWSLHEVCDRCDITNKPLSRYRYDEYEQADYRIVAKIAIGLKLSIPYIDDLMFKFGFNFANTPNKLNNILMENQAYHPRCGLVYTCLRLCTT